MHTVPAAPLWPLTSHGSPDTPAASVLERPCNEELMAAATTLQTQLATRDGRQQDLEPGVSEPHPEG